MGGPTASRSSIWSGKKREKVATHLATLWPPLGPFSQSKNHQDNVAAYVKLAASSQGAGLLGFKIHAYINGTWNPVEWRPLKHGERGTFPDLDLEIIRAVYAELGNSMPLMFDPGWMYNLDEAVRVGKVLDEMKFLGTKIRCRNGPTSDALMKDWITLRKAVKTPIMGPQEFPRLQDPNSLARGRRRRLARMDVCYGGFTPCLELVRYCEQHKIKIDLHAVPMIAYMLACYPITDDTTMPWIELSTSPPRMFQWRRRFPGSEPASKNQPWFKRMPT